MSDARALSLRQNPLRGPRLSKLLFTNLSKVRAQLRRRYRGQFKTDKTYVWPNGWAALVEAACIEMFKADPPAHWIRIFESRGSLQLLSSSNIFAGSVGAWLPGVDEKDGVVRTVPLWNRLRALTVESAATCASCGLPGRMTSLNGFFIPSCIHCSYFLKEADDVDRGETNASS